MYGISRGMMLNNPFNVRISSNKWIGKITPSTDPDFEQFTTTGDGLHAGLTILCNYYKLDGCTTIAQIIARWAPDTENPTSTYTNFVASACGIDRNNTYNVLDAGNLLKLASAIIEFEQGYSACSQDQIEYEIEKVLPPVI